MYFYLKNNKNGSLVIIRYHIAKGKERFIYSTGIIVDKKDWDYKLKHLNSKKRTTELSAIRKQLNKYSDFLDTRVAVYKLKETEITKELLKNDFDIKFKAKIVVKKTIIDYFEEMIDEKRGVNQSISSIKNYNGMKNKLIQYETYLNMNRKLTFNDFGTGFFDSWLKFSYKVLNNSDNTINRQVRYFKTFLIWAYKKDLHKITDYSQFKTISTETDDIALSKKEVFEILNFDFSNKSQQKVIDMFLIGCFTGQRFGDYSIFDKTDYIDGRIDKRAKKTKEKTIIPVDTNIYLKTLLEKYNWNLPTISNQKFNTILKKALSKIKSLDVDIKKNSYQGSKINTKVLKKWEMCGSHTARRTFITICLSDGWTYKEVMTVAGIKKVETLMKYDKISYNRLDNKTSSTWKEY